MQIVKLLRKALKEGAHSGICGIINSASISHRERFDCKVLMLKVITKLGYFSGSNHFPISDPNSKDKHRAVKYAERAYTANTNNLWDKSNKYCNRRRKVALQMIKELSNEKTN